MSFISKYFTPKVIRNSLEYITRFLLPLLLISIVTLTCSGCSIGTTVNDLTKTTNYDVSRIQKDNKIRALLPESITKRNKLIVGLESKYVPGEFVDDDFNIIGFDVDLGRAIGKILGVDVTFDDTQFAQIIPGVGSKYDIGISSFSITPQRKKQMDFVPYFRSASAIGVLKDNPKNVIPNDLCGIRVAVANGTIQDEDIDRINQKCIDDSKSEISIQRYDAQTNAVIALEGGRVDAIYADAACVDYTSELTNEKIVRLGTIGKSSDVGIVLPKGQPGLKEALSKSVDFLIKTGQMKKIFEHWHVRYAMPKND